MAPLKLAPLGALEGPLVELEHRHLVRSGLRVEPGEHPAAAPHVDRRPGAAERVGAQGTRGDQQQCQHRGEEEPRHLLAAVLVVAVVIVAAPVPPQDDDAEQGEEHAGDRDPRAHAGAHVAPEGALGGEPREQHAR